MLKSECYLKWPKLCKSFSSSLCLHGFKCSNAQISPPTVHRARSSPPPSVFITLASCLVGIVKPVNSTSHANIVKLGGKKNIGERPLGVRVVKAPTLHWTSWRISVKCSCLKGGTRLICHFCWNFPWTALFFFIHFVYCHMFSRYSHAVPFKGCWESLISVSYPGRNTHTHTHRVVTWKHKQTNTHTQEK